MRSLLLSACLTMVAWAAEASLTLQEAHKMMDAKVTTTTDHQGEDVDITDVTPSIEAAVPLKWTPPRYATHIPLSEAANRLQAPFNWSKFNISNFSFPPIPSLTPSERHEVDKGVDWVELLLRCGQNPVQQLMSGWVEFGLGLVPALGQYGLCTELEKTNQWCSATPTFVCVDWLGKVVGETTDIFSPLCAPGPSNIYAGLCVQNEDQCPTADLNRMLYNISADIGQNKAAHAAGAAWNFGGRCLAANATVLEAAGCAPYSFTYMTATCERDIPPWYEDHAAVIVFAVLMTLCGLVVISTLGVLCNDWAKEHKENKKKKSEDPRAEKEADPEKDFFVQQAMVNVYDGSSPHHNGGGKSQLEAEEQAARECLPMVLLTPMKWFDLRSSLGDLFTVKSRNSADTDTRFFEGLRFIAMAFVVYGHSLYFPLAGVGFKNVLTAVKTMDNTYQGITVYPAVLAVDVFFFLSGFLFLHLYMKRITKDHAKRCQTKGLSESELRVLPLGPISSVKMYVHRYLRLTPLVMSVLVVSTWLLPYLPVSGPLTQVFRNSMFFSTCKKYWWHQLLYITNLGDKAEADWMACMGWNWYMSCDMQMFILAPIIAAAYVLYKPAFFFLVLAGVLGSAIPGGIYEVFGSGPDAQRDYERPWYRAAPYVYGFFAAAVVRVPEVRIHIRKWYVRALCYLVGTVCLVSSINFIWMIHNKHWHGDDHKTLRQFAQAWAFIAWGGGLTLFTIPWACGHGGILPKMLSYPGFAVMSKLTFAMYLIHPVVIMIVTASGFDIPTFNQIYFLWSFGGFLLWAAFSAVCLWVLVEFPFAKMNDMLTK